MDGLTIEEAMSHIVENNHIKQIHEQYEIGGNRLLIIN
jgi:hypothetical protein